jgi:hypothetical protein
VGQNSPLGSLECQQEAVVFAPDHDRALLVAGEDLSALELQGASRDRDAERVVARQCLDIRAVNGDASTNRRASGARLMHPTLEGVSQRLFVPSSM